MEKCDLKPVSPYLPKIININSALAKFQLTLWAIFILFILTQVGPFEAYILINVHSQLKKKCSLLGKKITLQQLKIITKNIHICPRRSMDFQLICLYLNGKLLYLLGEILISHCLTLLNRVLMRSVVIVWLQFWLLRFT